MMADAHSTRQVVSTRKTVAPRALILTGYGINCDEETKFAFEQAGGIADIVHINDVIDGRRKLGEYQILAFPGGFSYGDDTGSGNALANKIRNHLWGDVQEFIARDRLAIGICNGFQVMVNLGLLPATDGKYGERQVALLHNDSARYLDRWVDIQFQGVSPWTTGVNTMSVPIAHGEGKLYADPAMLRQLMQRQLIAARYVSGDICEYQGLAPNPNGSLEDIAALQDETGRLIGMMPHPERAVDISQRPDYPLLKERAKRAGTALPSAGEGLKLFRNAIEYFA
jgi:phosphoribosylformylglycinamidine synthase